MYDAIVVGARCAGSPTAMLLARKGYHVLVVDKSAFPSDIMSTHFIQGGGAEQLQRWGLFDDLGATNCPPIDKVTFYLGGITFSPPPDPAVTVPFTYCPRRTVLDDLLVKAAVRAGAELRESFVVDGLAFDGERVTGMRGHAKGGAAVSEQARIVIGADGLHSTVARAVDAPRYNEKPSLTCGYYAYWSGVPLDGAELYLNGHTGMLAFPTNDDQACIAVIRPNSDFAEYRRDIEGNFDRYLDHAPSLAERVRGGTREERFIGTADVPNFFRKPYGDGWALVGDAGYHKDPITGVGITDAFRDAQLLADAIDAGFSEREPLVDALAGYERQRNEAAMPVYDFTTYLATFPEPKDFIEAMSARVAPDASDAVEALAEPP